MKTAAAAAAVVGWTDDSGPKIGRNPSVTLSTKHFRVHSNYFLHYTFKYQVYQHETRICFHENALNSGK